MRVTFERLYTVTLTDNDTGIEREILMDHVTEYPFSTITNVKSKLHELAVVDGKVVYPAGTWIFDRETGYYN